MESLATHSDNFRQKLSVDFQVGHLKIRTIDTLEKLKEVLALRSLCFDRHFEINSFELQADHLVIEDLEHNSVVVGAYRLTPWANGLDFETEEDFDIQKIFLQEQVKPQDRLEVGWACTNPKYREGHVIHLLWRGLSQYVKTAGIKMLFGPASVRCGSSLNLGEISEYIQAQGQDFSFKKSGTSNKSSVAGRLRRKIPPLLRAYLMAGAFVLLQPIFDPDTSCYDYLTVLDIDSSSDLVRNHFQI